MCLEEFREFDEVLPALFWSHFPPWALEGFAGCGYGDIDILLGGLLNSYDGLLGSWVDGLEGLAIDGFDEFTVDKPAKGTRLVLLSVDMRTRDVASSPSLLWGRRF